jgi:hypothetical protein
MVITSEAGWKGTAVRSYSQEEGTSRFRGGTTKRVNLLRKLDYGSTTVPGTKKKTRTAPADGRWRIYAVLFVCGFLYFQNCFNVGG